MKYFNCWSGNLAQMFMVLRQWMASLCQVGFTFMYRQRMRGWASATHQQSQKDWRKEWWILYFCSGLTRTQKAGPWAARSDWKQTDPNPGSKEEPPTSADKSILWAGLRLRPSATHGGGRRKARRHVNDKPVYPHDRFVCDIWVQSKCQADFTPVCSNETIITCLQVWEAVIMDLPYSMPLSMNISPMVKKVRFLFWWLFIVLSVLLPFILQPLSAHLVQRCCSEPKSLKWRHCASNYNNNPKNVSHRCSELAEIENAAGTRLVPEPWLSWDQTPPNPRTVPQLQSGLKTSVSITYLCTRWNPVWAHAAPHWGSRSRQRLELPGELKYTEHHTFLILFSPVSSEAADSSTALWKKIFQGCIITVVSGGYE